VTTGNTPAHSDPIALALDELVGAIEDSEAVFDVLHNAAPYDRKEHRVRHALMKAKEVLACDPPQPLTYATFAEAATTDAPDGATVTVDGREYEVVRSERDVARDAIIVEPVSARQCKTGNLYALVAGSIAYALVAGSYAHAEAAGSRAYAWAAGSYAYAWAAGSYAHAEAAGSRAYAWAAGSYAYAEIAGSHAHDIRVACPYEGDAS
jgi:hypothetical protein